MGCAPGVLLFFSSCWGSWWQPGMPANADVGAGHHDSCSWRIEIFGSCFSDVAVLSSRAPDAHENHHPRIVAMKPTKFCSNSEHVGKMHNEKHMNKLAIQELWLTVVAIWLMDLTAFFKYPQQLQLHRGDGNRASSVQPSRSPASYPLLLFSTYIISNPQISPTQSPTNTQLAKPVAILNTTPKDIFVGYHKFHQQITSDYVLTMTNWST